MKKLFVSSLFALLLSAGYAKNTNPVIALHSKVICNESAGAVKKQQMNPGTSTVTLTACGRTGTFTFSNEFTLGQIISICASIVQEFCHTGPCA